MKEQPRERVYEALAHFRPVSFPFLRRRRIGAAADGGYVVFDDGSAGPVYSFGRMGKVSFDAEMAALGRQVTMFDPGYQRSPVEHCNLTFRNQGLCAHDTGGPVSSHGDHGLAQYIAELGHVARDDLLLKLDLEGFEYAILGALADDVLRRFRQIVIEYHQLHRLSDGGIRPLYQAAFDNLARQFSVGHVHANNHAPLVLIDGLIFPDVLEVTYVRSVLSARAICCESFPTSLDYPNNPLSDDHLLWFFPFNSPGPVNSGA